MFTSCLSTAERLPVFTSRLDCLTSLGSFRYLSESRFPTSGADRRARSTTVCVELELAGFSALFPTLCIHFSGCTELLLWVVPSRLQVVSKSSRSRLQVVFRSYHGRPKVVLRSSQGCLQVEDGRFTEETNKQTLKLRSQDDRSITQHSKHYSTEPTSIRHIS